MPRIEWLDPSGCLILSDDDAVVTHVALDREFVNMHGETVRRYTGRVTCTPRSFRRCVGLASDAWNDDTIHWTIPHAEMQRTARHVSQP